MKTEDTRDKESQIGTNSKKAVNKIRKMFFNLNNAKPSPIMDKLPNITTSINNGSMCRGINIFSLVTCAILMPNTSFKNISVFTSNSNT